MRESSCLFIVYSLSVHCLFKSVENHLVDLLILFRVVIYLFILYDLPTNTA